MTPADQHSGKTVALRSALALVALVVLAWVGVLLRDFQVGHTAAARLRHQELAATHKRDLQRLQRAQFLNPESTWKESRAAYYLFIGRGRTARRLADELVRDEPDNLYAWEILGASTRTNPRRHAQATAAIRRLDPLSRR
jgi:predicted Zn-dependent protease